MVKELSNYYIFLELLCLFDLGLLVKLLAFRFGVGHLNEGVLDHLVGHAVVLDDFVEQEGEVGFALGESARHEVLAELSQLPLFVILTQFFVAKIVGVPLSAPERAA